MAHSEDHIALAAEYALGTLDADERAQVEAMMSVEKDFAAMVEMWERRLGPLNQMVGSVEPSDEVWTRIKAAVGISGHQQSFNLPTQPVPVGAPIAVAPAVGSDNIVALRPRASGWRATAAAATAIAASLLLIVGLQVFQPDSLPDALRPKLRTQTVQIAAPVTPMPAQYVAVLQKDGGSPAFILTVDSASKNFTVRKVGAANEPGKSYELWLVSDKLQKPRSLGVIGGNDFTSRAALSSYDTDLVNKATYAVTIEPEGGSPTGVATGPIVFSGKLVEAVPRAR